MFFRLDTDQQQTAVALVNQFAGPVPSACWLVGGGPSLNSLPMAEIAASPLPKMAINLAGCRLVRPTFWTSYDPSARFHRSIYLDPSVMKFVHRRRSMDLVPETTHKVCDCPNLYFFDRDGRRDFSRFLDGGQGLLVDWADSLVQAIEILYHLGFRRLFLVGCEMRIAPSEAQLERARAAGVTWAPLELLRDFLERCRAAGISDAELEQAGCGPQYHFPESKPFAAAVATDEHYFRIGQYLRLSRRAMALAGLELISVTPASRLNDYFAYRPVADVLAEIRTTVGDPQQEPTEGLYCESVPRFAATLGPMCDFRAPDFTDTSAAAIPAAAIPLDIEEEPTLDSPPDPHPQAGFIVDGEGWVPAGTPIEDG